MRMLLTSNGISNDLIRDALLDLLEKPIGESRVAVVIDAILGFPGDSSATIKHLSGLQSMGWAEFDIVSLFAGPRSLVESRLRSVDVILGYGGSNLWLAHSWTTTGLAPVLAELLAEKVYVGWSAGSMIFPRQLERWPEDFDDKEELEMFGLDVVTSPAPLFDWFFMGHLNADWMPANAEQRAASGAAKSKQPVWFVDDDTALVVRDPALEPVVVSSGHWLRFDQNGLLAESH